jgi:hypothetical protein
MSDKKKYYKLDEIGLIGSQEKKDPRALAYQIQKTGEAVRNFRMSTDKAITSHVKKNS